MQYNYKMEIFFNSNQINENSITLFVDKIATVAHKRRLISSYYNYVMTIEGTGLPNDFANIGAIISTLKKQDWFSSNVVKWLFYDSENGIEDLTYRYNFKVHSV